MGVDVSEVRQFLAEVLSGEWPERLTTRRLRPKHAVAAGRPCEPVHSVQQRGRTTSNAIRLAAAGQWKRWLQELIRRVVRSTTYAKEGDSVSNQLVQVPVDELMVDPNQPRRVWVQSEIDRLSVSIAARGVLQPLRVMWDKERKGWRIVIGESRWRAAKQAGLASVPCVPVEGA